MPAKQNNNETIDNAYLLLDKALGFYKRKKWKDALNNLSIAHKIFLANKKIDFVDGNGVLVCKTGLDMRYWGYKKEILPQISLPGCIRKDR